MSQLEKHIEKKSDKTVAIRLTSDLLAKIDEAAKKLGINRSKFIKAALKKSVGGK